MRTDRRRGNVTLVALTFGTMLGFTALSVDIGLVRVASTQLQSSLDAAALSGVGELDGTLEGIARARTTALDIATRNPVLKGPVVLAPQQVEIGTHDPALGTFTPFNPGEDPLPVNAVRIAHAPPPLSAPLGAVAFGVSAYPVSGQSLAVRPRAAGPAGSADCFLPLAIPDCHLASLPPTPLPQLTFTFNPSPTDSIAWGSPTANPNTDFLRDQLADPCGGENVELGDFMQVNEGVHNAANQTIADILNGATANPTFWDAALYGPPPFPPDPSSAVNAANFGRNTLEGAVALVDAGPDCSAVDFTGGLRVTGIGYAIIFDVVTNGGDKKIKLALDFVNPHEISGTVEETAIGKNVLAPGDPSLAKP